MPYILQKEDSYSAKPVLPWLLALGLLLVSIVRFRIPGFGNIVPLFNVMLVFYWGTHRRGLMPKWFVVVLGIMQDLLYGAPLGISSLLLLMLWWAVVSQRRFLVKENFLAFWALFAAASFLYSVLNMLLQMLYYAHLMFSGAVVMQWLMSVAFYPLIHVLSALLNRWIGRD